MRLMAMLVWLTLCGAVLLIVACSDNGSGSGVDAGPDGSTDTDTDSDTDADADAGPDSGTACVVYVNGADGDDGNTGESWTSALATVQAGLNLAEGAGCDVWVAAGTYLPTEDTSGDPAPDDERTKTILLKAGVAMYGGFAGDETVLEQRDIAANETILSGDIGAPSDSSDNVYNVVTGANGAIIDGFTITGGNADGLDQYRGGGMDNLFSSPIVANCTFSGNSADYGGGMYNDGSSPTVTGCTFSFNQSALGGGMYNSNGASPTVTNCTFSGNTANNAGGMYNSESSPTVMNCVFSGNTAEFGGGGMYNGIASSPTITNCAFSGNSAGFGGGMENYDASPTVTNCAFSANSANNGGGMSNGGGSSPAVTNCAFSSNSAVLYGGGMTHHNSSPTVTNCIMWGDTGESGVSEIRGLGESIDVEVDVTYSNIQGGYAGTGNIDADPLFISTTNLRLQEGSPCIDTGSNDAVPDDVMTDLDGNPRIVDGDGDSTATVDMGAYEVQP